MPSASRPAAVPGSESTGKRRRRDERVAARCPNRRSISSPRESFRNASTDTMMNVADAMSATGSRLRAGRCAAPRKARRASAASRDRGSGAGGRAEGRAPPGQRGHEQQRARSEETLDVGDHAGGGGGDDQHGRREAVAATTARSRGPAWPSSRGTPARRPGARAANCGRDRAASRRWRRSDTAAAMPMPVTSATPRHVQVHAVGADRANPPGSEAGDEGAAVGERAGGTQRGCRCQGEWRLPRGRCASASRPGTRRP